MTHDLVNTRCRLAKKLNVWILIRFVPLDSARIRLKLEMIPGHELLTSYLEYENSLGLISDVYKATKGTNAVDVKDDSLFRSLLETGAYVCARRRNFIFYHQKYEELTSPILTTFVHQVRHLLAKGILESTGGLNSEQRADRIGVAFDFWNADLDRRGLV